MKVITHISNVSLRCSKPTIKTEWNQTRKSLCILNEKGLWIIVFKKTQVTSQITYDAVSGRLPQWLILMAILQTITLYNTCVLSLLIEAHSCGCLYWSFYRSDTAAAHTNGCVFAHRVSAWCFCFEQQKTVFVLTKCKESFIPRHSAHRATCAEKESRLYSGTFLELLQSAGHHSATFLIVSSKCSLDTLFKRITR